MNDKGSYTEDYLSHHGVKGQKWGVRNAETLRKYAGPTGRQKTVDTSKKLSSVGRFVAAGAARLGRRVSERHANRKEVKAIAKSLGVNRRKMAAFKRLRTQTLRSHDPAVVERGMHTLTDSELNLKIQRLNTEKQVSDLVAARRNAALETNRKVEEARAARKNRRASGLGATLIKSTYNATVNYAGKKAVDSIFKKRKDGKSDSNPEKQQVAVNEGQTVAAEVLSVKTLPDTDSDKKAGKSGK